jgi:hypothetical protein
MDKTVFFKSCLGVFQGGGCRAAAFAGAYDEAVRRGVSFTEVAGTSAGAIVAALIGAGATPTFVRENLAQLDLKSLVQDPDRSAKRGISPARLLPTKYADLYFDQGYHSSLAIKVWMLGPKQRPPYEEVWHLRTVIIPRRSITGHLLWGTVLRRRDGSQWIYKKYVEGD